MVALNVFDFQTLRDTSDNILSVNIQLQFLYSSLLSKFVTLNIASPALLAKASNASSVDRQP